MVYSEELNFIFRFPTKIVFGPGTAKEVGMEVDELKRTRTLTHGCCEQVCCEKLRSIAWNNSSFYIHHLHLLSWNRPSDRETPISSPI